MFHITDKEFLSFSEYVEANYGIKLKSEKKIMITGRLQALISSLEFSSLTEYIKYVRNDLTGEAATILLNKITTNHTYFMREPEHFYYFRDYVLPLLKRSVKDRDLRIWCAASSTGEEPYTLAMIIDEFFGNDKKLWNTKLLATDISEKVLDIAQEGVYSVNGIKSLPKMWQLRYFSRISDENVKVINSIRDNVVYRKFNLVDEIYPFRKQFQVVFLRNVMIYFDSKTRDVLLNKIYNSLVPGGYLFIGHAESINRDQTKFKYIRSSVYMK